MSLPLFCFGEIVRARHESLQMGGNLSLQSTVSRRVPSLRQMYGVGYYRAPFSFFNSLRDGHLLFQRFPPWRGLTVFQLAWFVSKMLYVLMSYLCTYVCTYLFERAPPLNKWCIFPLILLAIDGKVSFFGCIFLCK